MKNEEQIKKCFICGKELKPNEKFNGVDWVQDYCSIHENKTALNLCSSRKDHASIQENNFNGQTGEEYFSRIFKIKRAD